MIAQFIIALREGIEAALVVGIILVFLSRSGERNRFREVYLGVIVAVIASVAFALGFGFLKGSFDAESLETEKALFEGITTLLAAGLIVTMIIWMERKGPFLRQEIETQVNTALSNQSLRGVFFIALIAVLREGVESVLFIIAPSEITLANPVDMTIGVSLGFLAAIIIAYFYFRLGKRINLKTFFRVTSVILVLFAAGMIGYGIHELQEAGAFPVIIEHVWDINYVIDENSPVGQILKGLIGYNGNPSLIEVIAYLSFLTGVAFYYVIRHYRKYPDLKAVEKTVNPIVTKEAL